MTVVLDTNVIYQALQSASGASHYILRLVREQKIRLAVSVPVFSEYEAVLKREESLKDFDLTKSDIDAFLRFIAYIAKPYTIFFLFRPNLRDENDNIFVELSLTANADCLITGNIKDFTKNRNLNFEDLKILTPSEFVINWRKENED